jgi:hypothetical protein
MRLLSIGFLLSTTFSFGQSTLSYQADINRIISRHYNPIQLDNIWNHAPDVYTALNYYFKESFEVEMANCSECEVDLHYFFNNDLFDVYEHESNRLDDVNFSFTYKEVYTVILLPKNDVYPLLQGLLPTELVNYVAPRDFPTFQLTNDDYAHYMEYKQQVYAWAKDFPEQYRAITSASDLLKISIRAFADLTDDRKSALLNHAGGYLIID